MTIPEEDYIGGNYPVGSNPFDNPEIEEFLFTAGESEPDEIDEFIDMDIIED